MGKPGTDMAVAVAEDPEVASLRARLAEAEETLRAIRVGEVDAVVITDGPAGGERVFALEGADTPYRVLVEAMREGAVTVDEDGTVLYANPRFVEMAAGGAGALVGVSLFASVDPADHAGLRAVLAAAAGEREGGGGGPGDAEAAGVRRELTLLTGDGGRVPVQVSARLIPASALAGRAGGAGAAAPGARVCLILTDLTASRLHEKVRASETEFRAAFETAGVGKAQVDAATGRFLRVNGKMCEITGYTAAELLARTPAEITHPDDRGADAADLGAMLRGELASYETEKRYLRKDGRTVWVAVNAVPVLDGAGRVVRTEGVVQDVTARRRAESALRDREERLRLALEAGKLGSWELDLRTGAVEASARCREHLGAGPKEALTDAWMLRAAAAGDRERVRGAMARAIEHGEEFDEEFSVPAPGGGVGGAGGVGGVSGARWLLSRGRVFRPETGAATRMIGVTLDITEPKAAEAALRRSEAGFRELADAMPQMVWTAGPDGKIDYVNRQFFEYGGEGASIEGWGSLVHPDDLPGATRRWERSVATGGPYEMELRRRGGDGVYRWHLARAVAVRDAGGAVSRWYGSTTEIDALKRAQEEIGLREHRLATAVAALPVMVYNMDLDERITWAMLPPGHATGAAQIVGKRTEDLVPAVDAARLRAARERVRDGGTGERVEVCVPEENGGDRHLEVVIEARRGEGGEVIGFTSAALDITGRKATELALRAAEERYRLAAEAVNGLVYDWDLRAGTIRRSGGLRDLVGVSPEEAPAEAAWWSGRIHPEDSDRARGAVERALGEGASRCSAEYRVMRADGRWTHVWDSGLIVRDGAGAGVRIVGCTVDVTAQKEQEAALRTYKERLEELVAERTQELEQSHQRLRLSERMAALGTLSAGIGHDMGNLLLPIRMRLETMRAADLPAEVVEGLDTIGRCAEYMQSLVRGLRLFALDPDDGGAVAGGTDPAVWCRDAAPFFRNAVSRQVDLEFDCPEGLPLAAVAPHRLTQAVLNLVNNAKDAIVGARAGAAAGAAEGGAGAEGGAIGRRETAAGRVTISVRAVRLAGRAAVEVTVEDDGPGMPASVRARCIEPFYTTKPRGISTGLGLALVSGIVRAAEGSMDIDSEVGHGTRIALTFPAAERAGPGPSEARRAASVTVADLRMAALIGGVLRAMGFTVNTGAAGAGDVWVTDGTDEAAARAAAFLGGGEGRRVITVGACGAAWEGVGSIRLPADAGLSDIRAAAGA